MQVHIHTNTNTDTDPQIECQNLNGETVKYGLLFDIPSGWHKITLPFSRKELASIAVDGEDLRYYINIGQNTEHGYVIWLNSDLDQFYTRTAECLAQDDILRFKDIGSKYFHTVSWNEKVEGDFVPEHIKRFFANGDGPYWYIKSEYNKLPYIAYNGPPVPKIDPATDLDEDLDYIDEKFQGQGKCKSLKKSPTLPTMKTEQLKNKNLRNLFQQLGFTDMLQITYVELEPKSIIPIHRDDSTYFNANHILQGPSQGWLCISGDHKKVKFKFKNAGLIDVSKPMFINNREFVHSLVYAGDEPRGVLLFTGISTFTNKEILEK